MPSTICYNALDLDSKAVSELRITSGYTTIPFCGVEEHRDINGETIASFSCYAIDIDLLPESISGVNGFHVETSIDIVKGAGHNPQIEEDGQVMVLNSTVHHPSVDEAIVREYIPRYRRGIFGSTKRKYTPAQRDERVLKLGYATMDNGTVCAREAFKGVRATIASILEETQGMRDVPIDFLQVEEFYDNNYDGYCTGMVVMSGEAFISAFLHATENNTYVLAAIDGRNGERVRDIIVFQSTGTAEDMVRKLIPAIMQFVRVLREERGDMGSAQ